MAVHFLASLKSQFKVNELPEKKLSFSKLSQDKADHLTSNDVYVVISKHLGF